MRQFLNLKYSLSSNHVSYEIHCNAEYRFSQQVRTPIQKKIQCLVRSSTHFYVKY